MLDNRLKVPPDCHDRGTQLSPPLRVVAASATQAHPLDRNVAMSRSPSGFHHTHRATAAPSSSVSPASAARSKGKWNRRCTQNTRMAACLHQSPAQAGNNCLLALTRRSQRSPPSALIRVHRRFQFLPSPPAATPLAFARCYRPPPSTRCRDCTNAPARHHPRPFAYNCVAVFHHPREDVSDAHT